MFRKTVIAGLLLLGAIMPFQQIGGGTNDPAQIINAVNQNIAQLQANESTQIFKDDTGTRRVLLGKGANDFYGLKVSQSGVDVTTATNSQLVFNSGNNIFKIVSSGTMTLPQASLSQTGTDQWNSGSSSVSVNHGLSYVPTVVAFALSSGLYYPLNYTSHGVGSFNNPSWDTISIRSDATTIGASLSMLMYSGTLAGSFTFTNGPYTIKYYILQETAN